MDTLWQLTGAALVLGIGATALLDLWSLLLNKGFGIKSLSFCLVGRWFAQGRVDVWCLFFQPFGSFLCKAV